MKKISLHFFALFLIFPAQVFARTAKQFPNISGEALFQIQADRVLSTEKKGVPANNGFLYIEPKMSLNFSKNWSVKTEWRFQPNNVLTTRDPANPERYRTFLQKDRGFAISNNGLIIEELKANFENEDFQFLIGKYDPTFGTAHRKEKRIGVFASQFTEDYNLREKIGASVSGLLENSKISFNSFMNDTTGLSSSALNSRRRLSRNDGLAGSSSTPSSYSVSMEGENFMGIRNWFYNAGYRSLTVAKLNNRKRETGYVFGSEYLYEMSGQSALIPFVELVKINNFGGQFERDAYYSTIALIGRYSGWTASGSFLTRNIKQPGTAIGDISDKQFQLAIGYKFTDNFTVDISRAAIKEDNKTGSLIGFVASYNYKF
jgi:hypothetical protein